MACFMEGVAWFTHKYVMHGFLWILHEDHHRYTGHRFEKNDLFAIFFSAIAILLFLAGSLTGTFYFTSMAIGVTLYGIGYVLFHDIMFHRRIKSIPLKPTTPYLKRIVNAHSVHHQRNTKNKDKAYGFLYASAKYNVD
ncbi:MAG: beta-carotene hydroxylase [Candidatus Aminicenantes bacterium]|nr:beta-carotene hydroxylase [Candidatus Aminicenantes bacterium]